MNDVKRIVTEKEFKDFQGVSYSRLSKIAQSPQDYKAYTAEDKQKSSAMALGNVIDILLTQPESMNKEVYIMTANKPGSELMQTFCEVYAETGNRNKAYVASGFKINLERVLTKFREDGISYYHALLASEDKIVVDADMMMKANQVVNVLKTNEFTKKYFITEKDTELHFQIPILWSFPVKMLYEEKTWKTINAKSIIDIVRIDHIKKVIQPVDLKTGAESFYKGYFKYKRYLQGAMYFDATITNCWIEGPIAKEYTIEPTKFIYADTNLVYPPVIYKMTNEDIQTGRDGRTVTILIDSRDLYLVKKYSNKFKYKGYKRLAAELDWHEKNDKWEYSYDVYQNDGEVDIDAFNVKL